MFAIEVLPDELRVQSKHQRYIRLPEDVILDAVDLLANQGWAVYYGLGEYVQWREGEPWSEYVARSAERIKETIQTQRNLYDPARLADDGARYFTIEAIQENIYLDKIQGILQTYFADQPWLDVTEETTALPLVAATVRKTTRSFSQGQRVFIYRVHGGRNEDAMVVGRYRRKHRWICGHSPIWILDNFRPKVVYDPQVIRALREHTEAHWRHVNRSIFFRFFATPGSSAVWPSGA